MISLLPPVHIAVLARADIVEDLDAALGWVGREDPARMSRAITFITGPSRTADIEQTIQLGAHGPRRLHIVLVDDGGD